MLWTAEVRLVSWKVVIALELRARIYRLIHHVCRRMVLGQILLLLSHEARPWHLIHVVIGLVRYLIIAVY